MDIDMDKKGDHNRSMTLTRQYEETHPWLNFRYDLGTLGWSDWMHLGEISSKCAHISGAPVTPDVAAELHQIYLAKGVHGTSRIEGNTLSEEEVRREIQGNLKLPRSSEYLATEIQSLIQLHNEIGSRISSGDLRGLKVEDIKEVNRRLLEGQPLEAHVVPGETRTASVVVGIGAYRGAPAEDCDYLLEKLVHWINDFSAPPERDELRLPIAIIKAILSHLYIAWIHPFGDGNGRTARLIEFQLMVEAGVPTPVAHLLSNHYNRTRERYLQVLDRTSRFSGNRYPVDEFVSYALEGLADEMREQIDVIAGHQRVVMWEKIVHDFLHEDTVAKRRQRHLMLDMPWGEPVSKAKIPEVSARVAREYGAATSKTVSRDVNALVGMGLLVRDTEKKAHFRPNIELLARLQPGPVVVR